MAPLVGPGFRALDIFASAGVGVLLALFYDLLRFFAGRGKLRIFVCDILIFCLAAVALLSYSLSFSYTGQLRWYMTAGTAAGALAYQTVIAPCTARVFGAIRFVLKLPFLLIFRFLLCPLGDLGKTLSKKLQKMWSSALKNRPKPLRKKQKVLYNSK